MRLHSAIGYITPADRLAGLGVLPPLALMRVPNFRRKRIAIGRIVCDSDAYDRDGVPRGTCELNGSAKIRQNSDLGK